MFDHSNTIEPRRLNKLAERLAGVTQSVDLGYAVAIIADGLSRDERSALSLLCTLYRLSPQMPVEDKIALWVHGPDGGKAATLTGDDLDRMVSQVTERLESKIEDLERQVAATRTVRHEIVIGDEIVDLGDVHVHEVFDEILPAVAVGENVYLVGPAGSGKTTIAKQVAEALGLDFYCYGAIKYDHDVVGYVDATGAYSQTNFYKAFKHGGLVLMDEMDASSSNALLALNAALANDFASFPLGNDGEGGMIEKHPDFVVIASANTFGHGASAQYVGRNPMDMATLDRFCNVTMGYDESLERAIAGNDTWVDYVQAVRNAVAHHKMRYVVSPRASVKGAKLLAAGVSPQRVAAQTIWNKGFSETDKQKIMDEIEVGIIANVEAA
jgi:MoxR-like ATPase